LVKRIGARLVSVTSPWYIVIGYDDPDFPELDPSAERALDEDHWFYIDQAEGLLARGPLLTADRSGHAGSVHVIAAPDLTAANDFAFNEPYFLAGLYASVVVFAFDSWLSASMWERTGSESAPTSWFIRLDFDERPDVLAASITVPDLVLCAGWLTTPSRSSIVGSVLLCDGSASDMAELVSDLTARHGFEPTEVAVVPWRRGGRTP
jgi:uncharacterized protein YciI